MRISPNPTKEREFKNNSSILNNNSSGFNVFENILPTYLFGCTIGKITK